MDVLQWPAGQPAQPVDDLAEVTALGLSIAARDHHVFAGRLDLADLRWTERLAVRAMHSATRDFRDREAIRAWAADLAALLSIPTDAGPFAPGPIRAPGEPWTS